MVYWQIWVSLRCAAHDDILTLGLAEMILAAETRGNTDVKSAPEGTPADIAIF